MRSAPWAVHRQSPPPSVRPAAVEREHERKASLTIFPCCYKSEQVKQALAGDSVSGAALHTAIRI